MLKKIISKKLFLFTALLFSFTIYTNTSAQNTPQLKFNSNGKFKILQFTDVHLTLENKQRSDSVMNIFTEVLNSEKPDFVVLTGDVATSKDTKKAWHTVTKPIIDAHIPWAVAFGNHDSEHGMTNKQIIDYLATLPGNLTAYGPKELGETGNYIIELTGFKTGKTEALFYFFDSHAYTGQDNNKELGTYDWLKFNQAEWYRKESDKYTAQNKKPFPALAFFHIPLPEYNDVQKKDNTIGDKDEPVASPKINSGMYCSFYEKGDVMGVFCGHDHNNTFIGVLNNIALVYGCKTGRDEYGRLDEGGRVIVLYKGERKFDTWVHTLKDKMKYFVTYPSAFEKKK